MGPIEILLVSFPGNRFKGEIFPELMNLSNAGIIRIVDLVFVIKDRDGNVSALEAQDVDEETKRALRPLMGGISGLLAREDIDQIGTALENNSSAAALLFENVWATKLRDAIVRAGGEFVAMERIPANDIDQALAMHAAS